MAEKDLHSSSDDSDADYLPEGIQEELSEEESGDESNKSGSDTEGKSGKQKSKRGKKKKKEEERDIDVKKKTNEKQDIDVNKIWADFKEDVDKEVSTSKCKHSNETPVEEETKSINEEPPKKVQRLNNLNFIPKPRGGLSSILNQIGKKNKMSTLEKSKQDWNNFKKKEGIEDELKIFNRGKDGYLEKQDFLKRTDDRQFEIEKQLRTTKRK